jgi:N-methylhydantoinase A
MSTEEAAAAVLRLATEHMARAIEEITVNQGIDPAGGVLVAGGGAAGLNAVAIARRIGAERVVIPAFGATLSAAGALLSDLTSDHTASFFTNSRRFDAEGVNRTLEELETRCRRFIADSGASASASAIDFVGEARYASQVWELEVPLRAGRFADEQAVAALIADFHDLHENVFAFRDEDSPMECVSWRATARCRLREGGVTVGAHSADDEREPGRRAAYFLDAGRCEADVLAADRLPAGEALEGPIIVESRYTTVVVDPGATVERVASGSLLINPGVGASILAPTLDARSAA